MCKRDLCQCKFLRLTQSTLLHKRWSAWNLRVCLFCALRKCSGACFPIAVLPLAFSMAFGEYLAESWTCRPVKDCCRADWIRMFLIYENNRTVGGFYRHFVPPEWRGHWAPEWRVEGFVDKNFQNFLSSFSEFKRLYKCRANFLPNTLMEKTCLGIWKKKSCWLMKIC